MRLSGKCGGTANEACRAHPCLPVDASAPLAINPNCFRVLLRSSHHSTEYLLYRATERLLYGKSLRMVRPIAKPRHDKMEKVGGDLPDKSYSYLTNLETPQTVELSRGFGVEGENPVGKKLDEILFEAMQGDFKESPDRDAILPDGVGGVGGKREEGGVWSEGEVKMIPITGAA